MQSFALLFGITGVVSLCLIDSHIDKKLYRAGKWGLGASALLFVVSQGLALAGF